LLLGWHFNCSIECVVWIERLSRWYHRSYVIRIPLIALFAVTAVCAWRCAVFFKIVGIHSKKRSQDIK
jgi:hypothetical protein